jgi:2-dehydro-3-deoxyglucarate aldolase
MTLKQKLQSKQVTIGSWLSFDHPGTTEVMARAGFEWLVVDMEHTATTNEGLNRLIQITALTGNVPLVRVATNDPVPIKHAMDLGAHGVLVPMVCTREEAERAAAALHYPPRGTRGVGLFRAQQYGLGFEEYKHWAAQNSVLIVQIEHWQGVERLEEILEVEAVDGFIVGPYDLSGSLGDPGNFQNPKFLACLEKIEHLARSHRKPAGYHLVHPDAAGQALAAKVEAGYRFIAYSTEMILLSTRVQAEVTRLRAAGHLAPE